MYNLLSSLCCNFELNLNCTWLYVPFFSNTELWIIVDNFFAVFRHY